MDFCRDAPGSVMIVKDVIFGIVTRAIYPIEFAVRIVVKELPVHWRGLAGIKSLLRRLPSHWVKVRKVVGSRRIGPLHQFITLIVEKLIGYVRVASASVLNVIGGEALAIIK